MDITKLKPKGPWVLVKVNAPEEKTKEGIYLPQGNLEERLGNATGVVIRVGDGYLNTKGKKKYKSLDLETGDTIMFRGFLQEANRPAGIIDREHSLIHADDIIGQVIE